MSVPLILVGAGGMGRTWLRAIQEDPRAELAGLVDLDLDTAGAALAHAGLRGVPTGVDSVALAKETGAQAVVNVTEPRAHHSVTSQALFSGLAVLSEKPVADRLPRALSLAAAAEMTGELFMVSQSRRYNTHLFALKNHARKLGVPGALVTEFFKAPKFGGFREQMAHPLLLDMAIHSFDTARFLLDAEPVSVYCEEFNPAWSWFDGAASASAIFEMTGGTRFSYTGSWCSPGQETSWNGKWRLSAEYGSVLWDGEAPPTVDHADAPMASGRAQAPGEGISGALVEFLDALDGKSMPMGEVHENIMSLVMVEAAVESAVSRGRVLIDEVLDRSHQKALADETRADVKQQLGSWTSVRDALTTGASL